MRYVGILGALGLAAFVVTTGGRAVLVAPASAATATPAGTVTVVGTLTLNGTGRAVIVTDAGPTLILVAGWQAALPGGGALMNKRVTAVGTLPVPGYLELIGATAATTAAPPTKAPVAATPVATAKPTATPTATPTPKPAPVATPIPTGGIRVILNVKDPRVQCTRVQIQIINADGSLIKSVTGLSGSPYSGQCYTTIMDIPVAYLVTIKAPQDPITYRPTTPLHVTAIALDYGAQLADTHVPSLTAGTFLDAPAMTANVVYLR